MKIISSLSRFSMTGGEISGWR